MSFGKPYILNINGCIHDGWLSLTTYRDLINKEFLRYVFLGSKNFFEKEAVGSGVRNLNIERVSENAYGPSFCCGATPYRPKS